MSRDDHFAAAPPLTLPLPLPIPLPPLAAVEMAADFAALTVGASAAASAAITAGAATGAMAFEGVAAAAAVGGVGVGTDACGLGAAPKKPRKLAVPAAADFKRLEVPEPLPTAATPLTGPAFRLAPALAATGFAADFTD